MCLSRQRLDTTASEPNALRGVSLFSPSGHGHSPTLLPFWVTLKSLPVWTTVISSGNLLRSCPVSSRKFRTQWSRRSHGRKPNPVTSLPWAESVSNLPLGTETFHGILSKFNYFHSKRYPDRAQGHSSHICDMTFRAHLLLLEIMFTASVTATKYEQRMKLQRPCFLIQIYPISLRIPDQALLW